MAEQISDSAKQAFNLPADAEVPWSTPNGIYAVYDLHCHCAAVRYKIRISPPLYTEHAEGKQQCVAVACECSYCMRNGYWGVHPLKEDIEWTHGKEHIKLYAHGGTEGKNPFWLCDVCGCVLGTDATAIMEALGMKEIRCTVNVKMLKDFDPEKIKVRKFEMPKCMPPKYQDYIEAIYDKKA
ncbi:hypothetical protein D0862_04809 [Hortaea werneckii]|uniref:CENP-V/GFA domain-containing protein n=1 Tax=Hortaea werneckii TaxID=91943 RepID=A0A3M7GXY5_HORWE|nr:hypothetical protein D0862_04809 [Hortaea werneckii]